MSTTPRITSNYNIITNESDIVLPNVSGEFASINIINNLSTVNSAWLKFNSDNVLVIITIDNQIILEADLFSLPKTTDWQGINIPLSVNANSRELFWQPRFPAMIRESIRIQAKSSDNSGSRKLLKYLIEYSKE